jgi:hypothetical protein
LGIRRWGGESLHDVIVGNFLAGISVHLAVFDAVVRLLFIWLKLIFSESEVVGIQRDRARERRKNPSNWRGAMKNS